MLLLITGAVFKMADEAENLEPESKRARLSPEPNKHLGNVSDGDKTKESNFVNVGDLQGIKVKENVEKTSNFPVDEADHTQSDEKKETGDGTSKSTFESSTVKPGVLKLLRVSDKDVGIFEFVSNLPGFHGVLKQRYTDFIVSERDPQGNLVRLTDVSVPQNEKTKEFHLDILSPEDREKIQQVIDEEEKNKSVILSPDDDKGHRTLVHRAIRENFSMLGKISENYIYKHNVVSTAIGNSEKNPRSSRWALSP